MRAKKVVYYCTYLCVFIIALEGPARGYPLRTCFFAIFKWDCYKENSCFEPGDFLDFGKVAAFKLI